MKKLYIISALCFLVGATAAAQGTQPQEKYRRSSLYSIMIGHPSTQYNKEIEGVFHKIPIPDKFDNHDLSVKIINTDAKKETEPQISTFLKNNAVARRMVAKWFDRDADTGQCNMELISQRGLYDATYFDVELSKMSQRGYAQLEDAGEELIGNTFVMVNDIRYSDKQKTAKVFGGIIRALGSIASAYTGDSSFQDLGNNMGALAETIKGFGVTVTTYLYRLEWNNKIATKFYSDYYINHKDSNDAKYKAFNADKELFRFKYIGSRMVSGGQTSFAGVNLEEPEIMVRKACTRAIDKSIVELQRSYDEFKVKTPIFEVTPKITAKIGLKEGVAEDNKYEVLEQVVDKNGRTAYKRVGIIQPVRGLIWDNRYMAVEENAYGAKFEATTFRKISGSNFYPGMLIRELRASK